MLCQHCNQNEATTFIRKNINGQKEELHLCSECAREMGVMDEFKMPNVMGDIFGDSFLGNFLGAGVAARNTLAGVERCNVCGSSFNDIVKGGHIGCSECYDMFGDKLEPSIRKIHGKSKHIGKFITYDESENINKKSSNTSGATTQKNKIDSLKEQLENAVKEQRFEDAAVIRDEIKNMTEDNNE